MPVFHMIGQRLFTGRVAVAQVSRARWLSSLPSLSPPPAPSLPPSLPFPSLKPRRVTVARVHLAHVAPTLPLIAALGLSPRPSSSSLNPIPGICDAGGARVVPRPL